MALPPTAVYLIPDPSAATGIQMIQLIDDSPGATGDGATVLTGEDQTGTATVTEHPVETGVVVTDNVRPEPEQVSYSFSMARTPSVLGTRAVLQKVVLAIPVAPLNIFSASALLSAGIGALSSLLFPAPPPSVTGPVFTSYDPVSEMHVALRILKDAACTCSVVTTTGELDNMLITSIKLSRKEAGGADFTVDLKQIFTVSSAIVDAPRPLQPRAQPAKSAGTQAPTPAAPSKATPLSNIGSELGL